MTLLQRLMQRNTSATYNPIQTAFNLQIVAIPGEFLGILMSYLIFYQQLLPWLMAALTLLIIRSGLYLLSTTSNQLRLFIFSNTLSIFTWMSYAIICAQMSFLNTLIAGLILTGLVSGALLFLTYIKYLYLFYSTFTLGVFAVLIIFKGGVLSTLGFGLLILVLFLTSLSYQYYQLSRTYFKTARTNSILFDEQQQQVQALSEIKDKLNANILNRQQIEDKIVQSNDYIQKAIQKSILDDEALQQEIMLIYKKVDYGILLTDEHCESILSNMYFSELWDINWTVNLTKTSLRDWVTQHINPDNLLFLNAFPFAKNLSSPHQAFHVIKKDGKHIEAQLTLFKKQNVLSNLWIFKDATDKHLKNTSITQLGLYDSLTALPARRLIYDRINELVKEYQFKDTNFAVAFIDINDFKVINDSLGHGIGNEILQLFAHRLQENIRPIDFVGRLGGDEFICIFNELTYKSDLDPLIKKLKTGLEATINLDNNTLMLNASIGVSFYPCDTTLIDELISFADIAMYRAKENTSSLYERFLPHFNQQTNELHLMGQELKAGLANNAFYLIFQPIYGTASQRIEKVEVLLRWRENVSPAVFIPLAERLGLIHEMGLWVLQEACKARYALSQSENVMSDSIKFCINISSHQLQTPKHIQELFTIVQESKCKPEWLEFELTESTLVDLDKAIAFINTLKSLGIGVAIDDFGTGFSSFGYLKNLYFDDIKIDKNFLDNIFEQTREMNIFLAIINLARMLDAKITVEGVETKAQYDFCVSKDCHYIQGFYMSRPVDFVTLLEKLKM